MNPDQIKSALQHAVTQYDAKQAKRAGYNRNALGIYFTRIDDIMADLANGADLRQAIIAGFLGRLADTCLKAVGLTKTVTGEDKQPAWHYVPASQR